jgi:ABC-type sugar transport system ATPase subunit
VFFHFILLLELFVGRVSSNANNVSGGATKKLFLSRWFVTSSILWLDEP